MTTNSIPSLPQTKKNPDEQNPVWTIRRLLEWTTDFFKRHHLPSARLDAEVLLAHVLQQDRLALYLYYDDTIPQIDLKAYRLLIQRRIMHEPVAYIIGKREFFSIPLAVGPSVLIPRPETEHLIEYALTYLKGQKATFKQHTLSILEIGTGSGNICITLAKHLPKARILAVDISAAALGVTKKNICTYTEFCGNISLLQGDLIHYLHPKKAKFHMVISNPPYIPAETWEELPQEVKAFEPHIALNGGPKGTKILESILEHTGHYLYRDGILIMEIGEEQGDTLLEKATETGMYRQSWIQTDYAGKPRVLISKK